MTPAQRKEVAKLERDLANPYLSNEVKAELRRVIANIKGGGK